MMDNTTDRTLSGPADPALSCGICQDLLPLVKDQVASGDSARPGQGAFGTLQPLPPALESPGW